MRKIFISVPMTGREEIDVRNDIKKASENIRKLYGEDFEIIHNYDYKAPENAERLWYLGEAIKQLGECDICWFVDGWRKSNGCTIEYCICRHYGIKFVEEEFYGKNVI